jgi:hypothetical protein
MRFNSSSGYDPGDPIQLAESSRDRPSRNLYDGGRRTNQSDPAISNLETPNSPDEVSPARRLADWNRLQNMSS